MQTLFSNLVDALQSENFHALSSLLDGLSAASDEDKEALGQIEGLSIWTFDAVRLALASLDRQEAQDYCVSLAKAIAELVKLDDNRSLIGTSDTFPLLIQILTRLTPTNTRHELLLNQILRCMGNLCFDHDSNRDVIAESDGGILKILHCISSPNPTIVTTALAVLLNLTMENSVSQNIIVENQGMEKLLGLLRGFIQDNQGTQHTSAAITSFRILCNLLESDIATTQFNLCNGLLVPRQIISRHTSLLDSPTDDLEQSLDILEAVGSLFEMVIEDESTQRDVIMDGVLPLLCKVVDHLYLLSIQQTEDDAMVEDDTADHKRQIMSLVKMYCVLVILSTLNDFCMSELARDVEIVNTFKRWVALDTQDDLEELELRMAGALCLGNLARSDDTCFHLVSESDVGNLLVRYLIEETNKLETRDPSSSVKLIQAISGALKNLSLSAQTRDLLGPNIFDVVIRLAENYNVSQIQFICLGIIKNLVSGQTEKNAYRLLMSAEPPETLNLSQVDSSSTTNGVRSYMERINRVIWNATGENDAGVRNEGGRISVNLLRSLQRYNAPQLSRILLENGSITLIVQIVTGSLLTQPLGDKIADSEPFGDENAFFDAPVGFEQVFPIVQNEGLVFLALFCALCPEAIPRIARFQKHLLHAFKPLLVVEKKPSSRLSPDAVTDDIGSITRVNVCQLLLILSQHSDAFRREAKDALFCHVETLSKKTLVSLLSTPSDSRNELTSRRNSSLLIPFPKDEAGLRMNGRRLSFQDTLKYRKELEVNVQQQGGLQKALSMQGSRSLEQTVGELLELFKK